MCNRIGNSNELNGRTGGWGDLQWTRPGVTVPAHGTISLDVTVEVVPTGPWLRLCGGPLRLRPAQRRFDEGALRASDRGS
ncbi:hypothetical protein GCM10018954_092590 [Kutzneria kofuensis]